MSRPLLGTAESRSSAACSTLDCAHCAVRHLAVCSALSPEEGQALEAVTV